MWLEKILDDLYGIASRIREIDCRYELFRNRKLERFEVYAGGALQLAVPFDRLDARTVEYVRKTRIENTQRLIAQIEAENEKLERQKQSDAYDNMLAQLDL